MKFEDLRFKSHPYHNGIQATYHFVNGYGVSVIRNKYSYGGESGLYEMAVLHGEHICYRTPITGDVIGYLTPEDVSKKLDLVEKLRPNTRCVHTYKLRR